MSEVGGREGLVFGTIRHVARATGFPFADLLFRFFHGNAITLLHGTFQLLEIAADAHEVVIGKLAPLGFRCADELIELAFDGVVIHVVRLCLGGDYETFETASGSRRSPSS